MAKRKVRKITQRQINKEKKNKPISRRQIVSAIGSQNTAGIITQDAGVEKWLK